jgi:ATP-dependent helicase/nuclease subunit A
MMILNRRFTRICAIFLTAKESANFMTIFQHKAISAAAGSGKTFRLAHRYMGLLARGVHPDRICALTFSRKAAGEIFDSIVRYLTAAASGKQDADLSSGYMEGGKITPGKFLPLLRCFVDNLHAVNIGTLDSFIVGIIRAFPLELGLENTDFNLMDTDSADAESFRESLIAHVCNSGHVGKGATHIFLEDFRQATLGTEKKTFTDSLKNFLSNYRSAFLDRPDENSWGNPRLIWKREPWWLKDPPALDQKKLEAVIEMMSRNTTWPKKMHESFIKIMESLVKFSPESEWEPNIYVANRVSSQIIEHFNFDGSGMLTIEYNNNEYPVQAELLASLRILYHKLFHVQFSRLFRRTKGIYAVISMFEKEYESALRQTGNMTFTDAQLMLSPHGFASGGKLITHSPTPQADRIFIDYRLDSKIDHFLLDEFQDTSNPQWQALENLVDEILQDDGNTRSFFYVGDPKQTIYRWRGGNPDLFNSLLRRYGKKIINEALNETQRSAQPIVDTVNRMFSSLPETQGEDAEPAIPAPVQDKWKLIWQEHKCGRRVPGVGCAMLLQPSLKKDAKHHEIEEQYELLAALLNRIKPAENGLSTAILVRTNKAGKKIADYLRQYCRQMNISYEGETALLDNPVIAVLLELLRYAEHPADNFAKQHLVMSPLGPWLDKNNTPLASLPLMILRQVQAQGFKAVICDWSAKLGKLDPFGILRLSQMLEIAAQFDERFDRDIRLFIKTVESSGMREISESKGCVHIMTIHQSKGLGFDLVILPDLNGTDKTNSAGSVNYLTGEAENTKQEPWLLTVNDRRAAGCDPVLKRSLENADQVETLDNLCLMYVAMTRAKKALYMITRIQKQKYFNMAALLEQQLAGGKNEPIQINGIEAKMLYQSGDSDWFKKIQPLKAAVKPAGKAAKTITRKQVRPVQLEKVEPSLEEDVPRNAAWLFSDQSPEVLHFGSAIHELLRHVEWADQCNPDEITRTWKPESPYPDNVLRDVKKQFASVMAEPKIKEALSKPSGRTELWREKSFDVVVKNKWISGIFDRVIIAHDKDGKPVSAQVIDYKSNRTTDPKEINDLADSYRPQLALYRQALSHILNLPATRIETFLLFTVPRQIVKI